LISKQGQVLVSRGYGLADIAKLLPAGATTTFAVGSITKTFTAAAALLLASEGKVSLDDRVSKFIPGFRLDDPITIRNLLDHSSGLSDYHSWPEYWAGRAEPISEDAFLAAAAAKPLDFAPGEKHSYSNTGYFLLASIIARASDFSYEEFVTRRLFEPLEMNASGHLADDTPVSGMATGYDPGFPPSYLQPAAAVSTTWLKGSGSIYSNAPDLCRWLEAVREHTLVNLSVPPYPYGWGKRTRLGREVLEQNGRVPIGYTSYAGLYSKQGVIVIVLSNIQADLMEQMGGDLAALAFGETRKAPTPRSRPLAKTESPSFEEYAGSYEISPGFVLSVRAVPQGLLLAGPDGAFLPLDWLGPDHLFFRPLYVPIGFVREKNGRIAALDWGGRAEAKRISD
jgi:CubicO group peptidase (beta-lactamase class C family)